MSGELRYPSTFRALLAPPPTNPETVDPLGTYAETYWLPILHPTAYILGRRLVTLILRAETARQGAVLELNDVTLAQAIGVAGRYGDTESKPSVRIYSRAMYRLERYKQVRWRGAQLEIRYRWPRLDHGLLSALPLAMQMAEQAYWLAEPGVEKPEFVEL